jgi:cation diffusion facilitator CzcD-associated flavoprotein CzcO
MLPSAVWTYARGKEGMEDAMVGATPVELASEFDDETGLVTVRSPFQDSAEELFAVAEHWVDRFAAAIRDGDLQGVRGLFEADGLWRDLLSVDWQFQTFAGIGEIGRGAELAISKAEMRNIEICATPRPRRVARAGVEVIEAKFSFETKSGRGEGIVRLRLQASGRAWTCLTTLQELHHSRTKLPQEFPRNFGGPNWLDNRREISSYSDRSPTVLVVGGGQCGLAIAARLADLEIDTLVVDRGHRVGDNWRNRYHALTLHNVNWVNHLPFMPFPTNWPRYVAKDKIANWLEMYAEAMELNVWLDTSPNSAVYDRQHGEWTVTLDQVDGDETRVLKPRHIVMATGVSGRPAIPRIPGLEAFRGELMHSSSYRNGKDAVGKRVLVIGAGNSGHDVAQDLHSYGARVTMVQRGPITVVDVETGQMMYSTYGEGLSTDDADLVNAASPYPVSKVAAQLMTRQMADCDSDLLAGLERAGFVTDLGQEDTGFSWKYLQRGGGYYMNVGCSNLIVEGSIEVWQFDLLDRVNSTGVVLTDGRRVDFDTIVLATGFRSLEFEVTQLFGEPVAEAVGPLWGLSSSGEVDGMWRRIGHPHLWFSAGSLPQSRSYSKYLALQIKAVEMGLLDPKMPAADPSGALVRAGEDVT